MAYETAFGCRRGCKRQAVSAKINLCQVCIDRDKKRREKSRKLAGKKKRPRVSRTQKLAIERAEKELEATLSRDKAISTYIFLKRDDKQKLLFSRDLRKGWSPATENQLKTWTRQRKVLVWEPVESEWLKVESTKKEAS